MVEQQIQLTIHTINEPETLFVTIGEEPVILVEALEARDDFIHFKINSAASKEALALIFDAISHALLNGTVQERPK